MFQPGDIAVTAKELGSLELVVRDRLQVWGLLVEHDGFEFLINEDAVRPVRPPSQSNQLALF